MATNNFFKVFKRMSVNKAAEQLSADMRELDKIINHIDYDLGMLRSEREETLSRGARAHKNGDDDFMEDAYVDLESIKSEVAGLENERRAARKAQTLCRVSSRTLKRAKSNGSNAIAENVLDVIQSKTMQKLINNSEISDEKFKEAIERELHMADAQIEKIQRSNKLRTNRGKEIFGLLADALESGDEDKVRAAKAYASGDLSSTRKEEAISL